MRADQRRRVGTNFAVAGPAVFKTALICAAAISLFSRTWTVVIPAVFFPLRLCLGS
jgi:hypothetical protein